MQCPSLWSARKPSVLLSGTIHSDCKLKAGSHLRDMSPVFIRAKRVNLLQSTVHRILTHWRNQKRSLFWKDHRSIFLTTANKEGMRRWLWQVSIPFSKLIQSFYSTSNPKYYPLPSLVQDTMRCCLEYIFISDPMIECKRATNLFRCEVVSYS